MAKDLNQCNFIGRVGSDPDTKTTKSGSSVCNFSIACNDDYKKKSGERVEHTEWVRLTFFGRLAEIASEYVKKGDKIYVSGKFKTDSWVDNSGVKKYSTSIMVNDMQMLGGSNKKGDNQTKHQAQSHPSNDFDDDIPF